MGDYHPAELKKKIKWELIVWKFPGKVSSKPFNENSGRKSNETEILSGKNC